MSAPTQLANFVAGAPAQARAGQTSSIIDPCTGEVIGLAPVTSGAELDAAFAAAAAAFETWRWTTPA